MKNYIEYQINFAGWLSNLPETKTKNNKLKNKKMNYTKTLDLTRFEFWSGAKQHYFTYNELKEIEMVLDDLYHETPPTETDINDLFWFEEELLCEWIGLDFDNYQNR